LPLLHDSHTRNNGGCAGVSSSLVREAAISIAHTIAIAIAGKEQQPA
jgi:hypothetical protein